MIWDLIEIDIYLFFISITNIIDNPRKFELIFKLHIFMNSMFGL